MQRTGLVHLDNCIVEKEKMKLNLPNKLTVLRLFLVPGVMVFILFPTLTGNNPVVQALVCAILFILTAVTDFIDGKIARKYNLITDFGKFMDPVADKFMVIGTLVCITVANETLRPFMVWVAIIVIFNCLRQRYGGRLRKSVSVKTKNDRSMAVKYTFCITLSS